MSHDASQKPERPVVGSLSGPIAEAISIAYANDAGAVESRLQEQVAAVERRHKAELRALHERATDLKELRTAEIDLILSRSCKSSDNADCNDRPTDLRSCSSWEEERDLCREERRYLSQRLRKHLEDERGKCGDMHGLPTIAEASPLKGVEASQQQRRPQQVPLVLLLGRLLRSDKALGHMCEQLFLECAQLTAPIPSVRGGTLKPGACRVLPDADNGTFKNLLQAGGGSINAVVGQTPRQRSQALSRMTVGVRELAGLCRETISRLCACVGSYRSEADVPFCQSESEAGLAFCEEFCEAFEKEINSLPNSDEEDVRFTFEMFARYWVYFLLEFDKQLSEAFDDQDSGKVSVDATSERINTRGNDYSEKDDFGDPGASGEPGGKGNKTSRKVYQTVSKSDPNRDIKGESFAEQNTMHDEPADNLIESPAVKNNQTNPCKSTSEILRSPECSPERSFASPRQREREGPRGEERQSGQ